MFLCLLFWKTGSSSPHARAEKPGTAELVPPGIYRRGLASAGLVLECVFSRPGTCRGEGKPDLGQMYLLRALFLHTTPSSSLYIASYAYSVWEVSTQFGRCIYYDAAEPCKPHEKSKWSTGST